MAIFFYGCVSIDGYLADKNHKLDWLHQSGSVEETDYEHFYQSMDTTIMGKRTFDEIKDMENVEDFYPTTKNYVFTHAPDLAVKGFISVSGDVVDFIKQIDSGKNIWIVGGNTILAPLLDHDMVDSMFIQIAPVLLGEGIPLFSQSEQLKRFYLKEVKQYGQFAELVYSKVSSS
ncbi:MAG TPA: dihydrofolate reductase family protein [Candidatus Jeotgalibaca pullicola]|uniref:Dihydrofolate reductase family protein n=1 Tax=Candidatus Jeotgalibaca merdavium TaxID=2838627 RepID=A0A9D2I2M2_9LACT|nr:dihydrofolate reductase family protein [Candidatus Jeotgalibaca merdavium]HJB24045.1 dihydrofolate reductase family protein [Candidatus Jeotgalibaca pullicola]